MKPAPWEEIWFVELHLPRGSLWLRYTASDHARRELCLWSIWFGPSGPVAATRPMALGRREPGDYLICPAGALTPDHASGDTGRIQWDLRLTHEGPPADHVPPAIAGLGRTYRSVCTDLRATGHLTVDGTRMAIPESRGVLGHLAGRRNRVGRWAWAHAAGLDGHPDVVFEGLSARLGRPGLLLPPMTSLRLSLEDRVLSYATLRDLVRTTSDIGADSWSFQADGPGGRLSGQVSLGPPATAALVEYRDDRDRPVWCRNSPDSYVRLTVDTGGRLRHLQGRLTAEIGTRTRPAGVVIAP